MEAGGGGGWKLKAAPAGDAISASPEGFLKCLDESVPGSHLCPAQSTLAMPVSPSMEMQFSAVTPSPTGRTSACSTTLYRCHGMGQLT